jgi:ribosome biogenesis GTPase
MEDAEMFDLPEIGFSPFFAKQLQGDAADDAIPARIAAEHRGAYEVWAAAGAGMAQPAGRFLREPGREGLPGVGDWVSLKAPPAPGSTSVIDRVLDRRTVFTRGAAGREARDQIVAANVDLVFVVCGLDADYNPRRIERYLARIRAGGAGPAVILNKTDVGEDAAARVSEVEARCPGVPVHAASALRSEGVEAIREHIRPGMTAALVGSSGAGKSTLVNALLGEDRMATGGVRDRDGRGRHVTTHRQLVLLPGGGMLLDTPGMRELRLIDDEGIGAVFSDIEVLSGRCRYRDCRHGSEPGCAVRDAVAEGTLPADRLEHYLKLGREARSMELRRDEHSRRKAGRVWGQLHDEVDRMRRWKRGE